MALIQFIQNYYIFKKGQIIPAEIKGKFLKFQEIYIPPSVVRILAQDNYINNINNINKQPKSQTNTLWDIIKKTQKSLSFIKK